MHRFYLSLLLLLLPLSGFAQVAVSVDETVEGNVGSQMVYQVKREIEDHSELLLSDTDERHTISLKVKSMPYSEVSKKCNRLFDDLDD